MYDHLITDLITYLLQNRPRSVKRQIWNEELVSRLTQARAVGRAR